jgi:hypothetical protein
LMFAVSSAVFCSEPEGLVTDHGGVVVEYGAFMGYSTKCLAAGVRIAASERYDHEGRRSRSGHNC